MRKKAIILFSGGVDSTVVLALALAQQRDCLTISFDYGQKHRIELSHAEAIAEHFHVPNRCIKIDPSVFGKSSLTSSMKVPKDRSLEDIGDQSIPSTYVPARNTLFLSFALGICETHGAHEIHFGPNLMDQASYPDCRPAYLNAFQNLIDLGTKQAVESTPPQLITPLVKLVKAEIISLGLALKAPLELTFSCYSPLTDNKPCKRCDACTIRAQGFKLAGLA